MTDVAVAVADDAADADANAVAVAVADDDAVADADEDDDDNDDDDDDADADDVADEDDDDIAADDDNADADDDDGDKSKGSITCKTISSGIDVGDRFFLTWNLMCSLLFVVDSRGGVPIVNNLYRFKPIVNPL